MGYSEKYISDYIEETYLKFLSDFDLLKSLIVNYNCRYKKNEKVDGELILFQESLDNYVIKKIKTDPQFMYSMYFKNYISYLQESLKYNTGFFFHNAFFHAFSKDELLKLLGSDLYNQISQEATRKVNDIKVINDKIFKDEELTQQELNKICDVYAFNRDVNSKYHKKLIEYIFQHLTKPNSNLVCSEYVLDTILAYITKYYPSKDGFNPIDCRIVADDENVKVAISKGNGHCLMNRSIFKNTNFKSINDSKKTYVKQGSDFTFLMVVANHELSHNYQKFMAKKTKFSNEGYMALKNYILNKELHDYGENHDSDDIEIDATEKSWNICGHFYSDFMLDGDLKESLRTSCMLNQRGTANRRFDYFKKDNTTGTVSFTPFYDISNLNNILSKKAEYIKQFPMLKVFYDDSGKVSLDFLKIENICNQSIGADYFCFMCIYYPNKVLNYLNQLNDEELNIALLNINYAFSKYRKSILYYDYNDRNNLSSEHIIKSANQESISLLKSYQTLLKLYTNLKDIYKIINAKHFDLDEYEKLLDNNMALAEEQYNKFKLESSKKGTGAKR